MVRFILSDIQKQTEAVPIDLKAADAVTRTWYYFTVLWFPALAIFGLIMAIKFFVPTFLVEDAWLTFGRIRPAHVNGLLFGFLSSGLIGTMYYVIPRLTNSSLYKPTLCKISAALWNIAVLVLSLIHISEPTRRTPI